MGDVLDLSEEKVIIADDDSEVGNSFFETRYHGFKILVLVPNPSDEINLAGAMILNLIKARANVFVAFMNGNLVKDTKILREAENSLKIFGLKRDHIIYLENDDILSALKKILIEIEADVVFCTDFDIPVDHQKLSVYFDQAMGEILSRIDNKYPRKSIFRQFDRKMYSIIKFVKRPWQICREINFQKQYS